MGSKRPPTLAEALAAIEADIAELSRRITEVEQQSHLVSAILQTEGVVNADLMRRVGGELEVEDELLSAEIEKLIKENVA